MKTEPFLSGKYGWNLGESGWKTGADENFLKFSYMINANVNGFVSTLPASPSDGTAYHLSTDNTLNARVEGAWIKYNIPKGYEVTDNATGLKYVNNGSTFLPTVNSVDKAKLDGISSSATANSSDASLRDRATHTGAQAMSTVTGLDTALNLKANLVSPTFTGLPTAPTVSVLDNSTSLATTAYVKSQGYLTIASAGITLTVAGRSGAVTLTKADVGLNLVDNTPDITKPISVATQTALNGKVSSVSPILTGNVTLPSTTTVGSVTAAEIGYLSGVTSSIQAQINSLSGVSGALAPINNPNFTGTVTGVTKAMVGLGNADNTSDISKPVSTATQTALNGKQDASSTLNGISSLASGSGFLKLTGGSASLDLSTYLTGINYSQVVGALGFVPISKGGDVLSGMLTVNNTVSAVQIQTLGNVAGGTVWHRLANISGNGSVGISLDAGNNGLGSRDVQIIAVNNGSNQSSLQFFVSNAAVPNKAVEVLPQGTLVSYYSVRVSTSLAIPLVLNTSNAYGQIQTQLSGVPAGYVTWDSSNIYLNSSDTSKAVYVGNSGAGVTGTLSVSSNTSVGGNLTVSGNTTTAGNSTTSGDLSVGAFVRPSSGDQLNLASRSGTDSRIGLYTSDGIFRGGLFSNSAGNVGLLSANGTVPIYVNSANAVTVSTPTTLQAGLAVTGNISASGNSSAASFTGDGSGLTSLNASNASSGTLPDARLSGNVVTKFAPSQYFQSVTANGNVTINSANGTHIIATCTAPTIWTFPSVASNEAMALTLELTNGGSFTQTWPAGTKWTGGTTPTLTASGTDIIVFTKAGTNAWRGYLSSKDNR